MKTILCLLSLSSTLLALDRPKLQIINAGPDAVEVFWKTPDGRRVSNGKIEPGKDSIIGTTIGHRFIIVDGKRGQGGTGSGWNGTELSSF